VPAPGFGSEGAPAAEDAITVHQDASVYAGLLEPGVSITHRLRDGFGAYLMVVRGSLDLKSGDGAGGMVDQKGAAKIGLAGEITVSAGERGAEVLLVEVALPR
jgi:redox-sensitive bicupin YhaK (pirin superfamily)